MLGSTGSIGTQTLDIVAERPELYEVTALAAGNNVDLLAEQIIKFRPAIASLQDEARLPALRAKLLELGMPSSEFPELVAGPDGVVAVSEQGSPIPTLDSP